MTLGVNNLHNTVNWWIDSLSLKQWSCKSYSGLFLNSMTHQNINIFLHIAFYAIVFTFLIQRRHFLISLFSLEGIILTLVAIIPLSLSLTNITIPTIRIIILTFGACEARLGLRLIVMISRYYGRDIFKSLSTNKC